jgi:hypothetical protein
MGILRSPPDRDDQKGPQREYPLREIFNVVRWLIRVVALVISIGGFHSLAAVYQQPGRWIKANCFTDMVHDLRILLREA